MNSADIFDRTRFGEGLPWSPVITKYATRPAVELWETVRKRHELLDGMLLHNKISLPALKDMNDELHRARHLSTKDVIAFHQSEFYQSVREVASARTRYDSNPQTEDYVRVTNAFGDDVWTITPPEEWQYWAAGHAKMNPEVIWRKSKTDVLTPLLFSTVVDENLWETHSVQVGDLAYVAASYPRALTSMDRWSASAVNSLAAEWHEDFAPDLYSPSLYPERNRHSWLAYAIAFGTETGRNRVLDSGASDRRTNLLDDIAGYVDSKRPFETLIQYAGVGIRDIRRVEWMIQHEIAADMAGVLS